MNKNTKKLNKTRKIILQYLYSLKLNENTNYSNITLNKNKIDYNYLVLLIKKIKEKETIIELIIKNNITNINISILEELIIKIAIFELFFIKSVKKIIINEAILLAKEFCSKNSYKLVNKILDITFK